MTSTTTTNEEAAVLLRAITDAIEHGHIGALTARGSMVLRAARKHAAAAGDYSLARANPVRIRDEAPTPASAIVVDRAEARTELRGLRNAFRAPEATREEEAATFFGHVDEVPVPDLTPTMESAGPDTIIDSAPENTAPIPKKKD